MTPTFVVGIPHASWQEQRVAVLQKMLKQLGPKHPVGIHNHRMPRLMISLYSEYVYRWLVDQGRTHCVFMSDDLDIMPRFWDVVTAMVTAVPDKAIALDSLHPRGKQAAEAGGHWYRCKAWMAGPAMLWPTWMLADHLKWRDAQPLRDIRDSGDDGAFNDYLSKTGQFSWHPVPAPVDHDADMPTAQTGIVETVEKYRRPPVLWHDYDVEALARVETWQVKEDPPFFHVPSEEARLGIT